MQYHVTANWYLHATWAAALLPELVQLRWARRKRLSRRRGMSWNVPWMSRWGSFYALLLRVQVRCIPNPLSETALMVILWLFERQSSISDKDLSQIWDWKSSIGSIDSEFSKSAPKFGGSEATETTWQPQNVFAVHDYCVSVTLHHLYVYNTSSLRTHLLCHIVGSSLPELRLDIKEEIQTTG